MIFQKIELFRFNLILKFPLKIANKEFSNRHGLIIKIFDENQNYGLGEISPLPGLHEESLIQVIDQVKKFSASILKNEIPENICELNGQFDNWFKKLKLFPSVQFGFESALVHLQSKFPNRYKTELFTSSRFKSFQINALLAGSESMIIDKLNKYLDKGFRVFKLKIGRNTINKDIKIVNRICSLLDRKTYLRLDVNMAWTLNEALYFLRNIDHKNLEYVEEPLINIEELPELYENTKIPFALDENILQIKNDSNNLLQCIKAIIIKPTVIGGIEKSMQFIKLAESNSITSVISDTFQSGVGLYMLLKIASTLRSENIAMGFDTYSWLKQDLLINMIGYEAATMKFDNNYFSDLKLNYNLLQKIDI